MAMAAAVGFAGAVSGQTPKAGPAEEEVVSRKDDPADVRTRLVVRRGKDGKRGVASLGKAAGPTQTQDLGSSRIRLLERELIRQAVLIAARDELGASTRDELLDDAPPVAGEGPALEISTLCQQNRGRVLAYRIDGPKKEILLAKELPPVPDGNDYPAQLAAIGEALARNEFVAILKQAGLAGKPNAVRDRAPVPAAIEDDMTRLGLVENFAAARALHDLIRTDGESPERLGALARTYARLGMLTRYQWSAAHRAFEARALLYAERLVARDQASPWGHWNRAFVNGLVGLHAVASSDLASAKALNQAGRFPAPDWVDMIDAYLRYDLPRLKAVRGSNAQLAALLTMKALEYPIGTAVSLRAAHDVLEADPDCAVAFDVLSASGHISEQHQSTVAASQTFEGLFPEKVKAIKNVPAAVRAGMEVDEDSLVSLSSLDEAGKPGVDEGEPPWGVLAHLAREARFANVRQRLVFMRYTWGVPVDEYWREARGLVQGHRFEPYLEAVADPKGGGSVLGGFMDRYDPSDYEASEVGLSLMLSRLKHPKSGVLWGLAVAHTSLTVDSLSEAIVRANIRQQPGLALSLHDANTRWPFGMACLIHYDWEHVKGKVEAWKAEAGDAPTLLVALADKAVEEKRYDEAVELLNRCVKGSAETWLYERIAECHRLKGDVKAWRATLDRCLAETDQTGLAHAQIRIRIADWLASQKRWAEAKVYADDAAPTGSASAMTCAARVAEGLGDLDGAESWYRQTSERYPDSSWSEWYVFCQRTGHGDLAKARKFAEARLNNPAFGDVDPSSAGCFYWSIGDLRKALERLEAGYREDPVFVRATPMMLVADRVGDRARRDLVLEDLCVKLESQAKRMSALCRLFRDALAKGEKSALDLVAVDKIQAVVRPEAKGNTAFMVGAFLQSRGRIEEARKYLRIAADTPGTAIWYKVIAASTLRSWEAKTRR